MSNKKKKDKTPKKVDPNKLNEVDRTFCELTITDLNTKLARLREHLVTLEDRNVELNKLLMSDEADRTDVAAHLQRTLNAREIYILELEERLTHMTKLRNEEKKQSLEQIRECENKFKTMYNELTLEVTLLSGKLKSLDEFRIERDAMQAKFEDLEELLMLKELEHKEIISKVEEKALVEKNTLKQEVEGKLQQVSQDFLRSAELRNASYTRRLIRENVALQKELDTMVKAQMKMQDEFQKHLAKNKEMSDHYEALDQLKDQLIKSSQNKIEIIEKLTDNYERLKSKYLQVLKYNYIYKNISKRDVNHSFDADDTNKKQKLLQQQIQELKLEKNRLMTIHEQNESEIAQLSEIIRQIKKAIEFSIDAGIGRDKSMQDQPTDVQEEHRTIQQLKRNDLLTELMGIISTQSDCIQTQSVASLSGKDVELYKPGTMGLLPRPSLMKIYKTKNGGITSTQVLTKRDYVAKTEAAYDGKIVARERIDEAGYITDIEIGSTLYVSSSHGGAVEIAPPDDEREDMGEEESSEFEQEPVAQQADATLESPAAVTVSPITSLKVSPEAEENIAVEKTSLDGIESKSSHGSHESGKPSRESFPQNDDNDDYNINLFY